MDEIPIIAMALYVLFFSVCSEGTHPGHDPPSTIRPMHVDVGVYIETFHGITEMEFEINFWLNLRWLDPRNNRSNGDGHIPLGKQPSVWVPDIFFTNVRKHTILQSHMYVDVDASTVLLQYITGKFQGKMIFRNFPFDEHTFELFVESLDVPSTELVLRPWFNFSGQHKDATSSESESGWSQIPFTKEHYNCGIGTCPTSKPDCSELCAEKGCSKACGSVLDMKEQLPFKLAQREKTAFSGACSGASNCAAWQPVVAIKKYRVSVLFRMKRITDNVWLTFFVPCSLVVVISWLSFITEPSEVNTRFMICLVALLAFETMSSQKGTRLPNVEYTTWVHCYQVFNLLSLGAAVFSNGLSYYAHTWIYSTLSAEVDQASLIWFPSTYFCWMTILLLVPRNDKTIAKAVVVVVSPLGLAANLYFASRGINRFRHLRVARALVTVLCYLCWVVACLTLPSGQMGDVCENWLLCTVLGQTSVLSLMENASCGLPVVMTVFLISSFCITKEQTDRAIVLNSLSPTQLKQSIPFLFLDAYCKQQFLFEHPEAQAIPWRQLAFERIARKAGYSENPLLKTLTAFEYMLAVRASLGRMIDNLIPEEEDAEKLNAALEMILGSRTVVYKRSWRVGLPMSNLFRKSRRHSKTGTKNAVVSFAAVFEELACSSVAFNPTSEQEKGGVGNFNREFRLFLAGKRLFTMELSTASACTSTCTGCNTDARKESCEYVPPWRDTCDMQSVGSSHFNASA